MPQTPPSPPATEKAPSWWKRKRFGGTFLFVSIALHLLFGVGATYLVVQSIAAKRALAFQGGPPNPSRSQKAVEHRVQVAKQKQTSSAPAPPRRVAVAGLAKVSLPEMPSVPVTTAVSAAKLGGMGGSGGFGMGPGTMGGGSGSGGRGGGIPVFGMREPTGGGLRGTFYDTKQTPQGQPTEMGVNDDAPPGSLMRQDSASNQAYAKLAAQFIKGGLNEGLLSRFYRGPAPLFTSQVFIPAMDAGKGPEAFNLADKVKPKRWMVVYRGNVTPPESGSFRFVGFADDVLAVRFNGRLVLDGSLNNASGLRPKKSYLFTDNFALFEGDACNVTAGTSYPLEIVIGEQPGGSFAAFLLIEKEGVQAAKSGRGYPLLPIFKLAPSGQPGSGNAPEFAADTSWSIWKGTFAAPASSNGGNLLDQLRKN